MATTDNNQSTIIRNGRGLGIAGTRITLYDIMDYVKEGWTPQLIQYWFNLTDQQIADVMEYIETHRVEVETEYEQVLQQAEEIRQYWEERNRDRFEKIAAQPHKPDQESLWLKLEAQKIRIATK